MSKLIKALEVIKNECKEHFGCNTCPLRYKDADGVYICRLDNWIIARSIYPLDWPIEEVRGGRA